VVVVGGGGVVVVVGGGGDCAADGVASTEAAKAPATASSRHPNAMNPRLSLMTGV
jgi:hypothetical protein